MSPRQQRHRLHANPFNVRATIATPPWNSIYGRNAPFALDIGFGAGAFTLELAKQHPEWNVLGLEIRTHFVESLLHSARVAQLTNLYALQANANLHIKDLLPDQSVAFVAINFPDPWYKRRHTKRRVVKPDWVKMLSQKLLPNSELHAMTDYKPVALEILKTLEAEPGFINMHGIGCFANENTTGITSERELTHIHRQEPIFRLFFRFCKENLVQ